MKINRTAKPGKIMKQPPKKPNSGKMDSQIFLGKKDPQKKKKNKKSSSVFNLKNYREAKLRGFMGNSNEKFQNIALKFIRNYFSNKKRTPTLGDVILNLVRVDKNADQDLLKMVATSALSTFNNSL